jgi:antitoxin ParD1/3/4
MRTTMNISLPDSMKAFVDEQVAKGGFGTASEYVRHVLREEQKRRLREQIDAKLLEALDSGEATPMTADDWVSLRRGLRKRLTERKPP